ncbi:type II toxin-antitoxin system PemK/MazF family toxin [Bacillus sp. WOD8 KX774193]|uniref:type II toxin-antitoxin system PemK/MazF family toxin n=1 Tax=Bacillus sp. WOD8 KX774193 TaxID=3096776 RepID=UPI002DBBA4DB|nr:type II toxin-antitoxin system PemK/MazF family toxin [Bacillus sp. WOD8 KX774193]MEC3859461.1 type II toxin-antitoxin system PemK/MazF family toxin [Bacillus sp. WOD8 KX774193]
MDSVKRKEYKDMIKRAADYTRPCDGKKATSEPGLILDVIDILKEYDSYIREVDLYDAVNLLLGLDLYVKDKMSDKDHSVSTNNYKREKGRIVTVELFGHFDKELTYEHPCIVIAGGHGWAVVAPISSSRYGDRVHTHIDLDPPFMSNKCGIMLENLRYVSEKRIIRKFSRLTAYTSIPTDPHYGKKKLTEIDEKLAEMLLPYTHKGYQKKGADLIKTQKDLEESLKENDQKEQKIKEQEEQIKNLEDIIRRLESEKEITV